MGARNIDRDADYSNRGFNWFGIKRFINLPGLEAAYFFGNVWPDKRHRDLWDYAGNNRILAPRVDGIIVDDYMQGGYYTTPITPFMLGPAFSLAALVLRGQGKNGTTDAAYISDFQSDFAITLSGSGGTAQAAGNYSAIIGAQSSQPALGVATVPMTASTGQKWELLVLSVDGRGSATIHVVRPGEGVVSNTVSTLPPNAQYSKRAFRIGKAYDGAFAYADAMSSALFFTSAIDAAGAAALFDGLRRFARERNGPALG